jgi:E3 ubiquitin-protein ligase RNF115/126
MMSTHGIDRFIQRGAGPEDGPTITGPIMAQYLMALLGQRDPTNEMFGRGLGDLTDGRMGDYVFNQEGTIRLS